MHRAEASLRCFAQVVWPPHPEQNREEVPWWYRQHAHRRTSHDAHAPGLVYSCFRSAWLSARRMSVTLCLYHVMFMSRLVHDDAAMPLQALLLAACLFRE